MPAVAVGRFVHTHARASRADGYARRRPEDTVLHQVLHAHWPAFLERAEEAGGLPRFVVREFEAYLECGKNPPAQGDCAKSWIISIG